MESGRVHRSCGDLVAMEFGMEEDNSMVKQFSPVKPHSSAAVLGHAGARRLFAADSVGVSPTAIAEQPPYAISQPSSATSSLATALADLQVSSRQSSSSDLGDRSKVLAFAAAQAAARGGASHSRSSSKDELPLLSPDDSLCSPVLIGAVRSFDTMVLKTLTPIKTRGRSKLQQDEAGGGDGGGASPADRAPSAPAPSAEPLPSPFGGGSLKPRGPLGGRAVVFHTRSSSMAAPGAYNPYDTTAAALSSEFISPAKSLYSPFQPSSRATSTGATPSQWGSASYRGASYRALAAQQALAQTKDDEPDYYVSVPGVRRQQSGLLNRLGQSQSDAQPQGKPAVAAASTAGEPSASHAASPAASLQRQPSSGSGSLLRHVSSGSTATLGSGTAVHGFKGLFRNVIVRGPSFNGQ